MTVYTTHALHPNISSISNYLHYMENTMTNVELEENIVSFLFVLLEEL